MKISPTLIFSLLLSLVLAGNAYSKSASQKFAGTNLTKVKVKKTSGNIEIYPATGNDVVIEKAGPNCQTAIFIDRTTLKVLETDPNVGKNCPAPLKVYAPVQIKVDVEHKSGNITAQNFPGNLDLELDNGTITCTSCTGHVDADVDNGKISLTEFAGSADLDTDTGDIDVQIAKAHNGGGELELETHIGSIKVAVPASLDVMANTHSFIGKIHNDFGPASSKLPVLRIEAETRVGSITINKVN